MPIQSTLQTQESPGPTGITADKSSPETIHGGDGSEGVPAAAMSAGDATTGSIVNIQANSGSVINVFATANSKHTINIDALSGSIVNVGERRGSSAVPAGQETDQPRRDVRKW